MSCASLSRDDCRKCRATTLHNAGECVHCGTLQAYVPIRDDTIDVQNYTLKGRRGAAKRNSGRKKALKKTRLFNIGATRAS